MSHRQRAEEVSPLRHEGDPFREQFSLRLAVDALALEADLARTRNEHPEQRLQHGRLSGAVRTDEQRNLRLARVEGQLVEDRQARRIARDDLVEFHRRYIHPNNAVMGVAGDFDGKAMKKLLEETFRGWTQAKVTPPPIPKVKDDFQASCDKPVWLGSGVVNAQCYGKNTRIQEIPIAGVTCARNRVRGILFCRHKLNQDELPAALRA